MRANDFEPKVIEEIIRRYRSDERVASIAANFTASGREMTMFDVYQTLRNANVPRNQPRGTKVHIPDIEEMANRYRNGAFLSDLAAEAGVASGTMRSALVKAGVEIDRGRGDRGRPPIEIPNLNELAKRNAAGESVRSLAQEAGVSRMTLKRRLDRAGEEE